MKRTLRPCSRDIAMIMIMLVGARGTAQETHSNLITNGSLDEQGENGDPRGWTRSTWGGSATFTAEPTGGRSGTRCVSIGSDAGADASWSFKVSVRPRTRYRLSAWIKTARLERGTGLGALVNLHELQMTGKTQAVLGDQDWTRVSSEFESGSHRSLLVNLLVGGWGQSSGRAWFDDVEILDLTEPLRPFTVEEGRSFFREKVHPVLEARCFECHGPSSPLRGGLFLGSREGLERGGDSGAAIHLQTPRESLLLSAINHETFQMPPSAKLPRNEVDILTTWVTRGAPWDPALAAETPPRPKSHRFEVTEEHRSFWSFRPVERPEVPDVSGVSHIVDRFIRARLSEKGIRPAARARRADLSRRATYDLTGLPPTPAEVLTFLADPLPDAQAFAALVDRLLESPHYGEKWGRHWLDLVRYAESNSFERDGAKPHVWKYRDWVVDAFNQDLPYDQFLIHQLAGDELADVTPEGIIATGYYRLGAWDDEPADPEQALFDDLDDILTTTSQAVLGLTLNCARCHDHKLDPIPQTDYYRMLAFFRNVQRYGDRSHESVLAASVRSIVGEEERAKHQIEITEYTRRMAEIQRALGAIEDPVKTSFEPVEHEEFRNEGRRLDILAKRVGKILDRAVFDKYRGLTRERDRLRREKPPGLTAALCVTEHGAQSPPTHVLVRGNPKVRGRRVAPGFPEVLGFQDPTIVLPSSGRSSGHRLALARWCVDPKNPLTARVFVNRVWQHHFGHGLVRSPNNFGMKGEAPTHPELLDWLAAEFVANRWSLKSLHRLLMNSETYCQSTRAEGSAESNDPANEGWSRFLMRRLTAEEIRDSILAVSGNLTKTLSGPSVYPKIPKEVLAGQSKPGDGWGHSSTEDRARRSIYIHAKRSLVTPLLAAFDMADTDFTCPVRFATVQPTQALTMLNSDFLNRQGEIMAEDLTRLHPGDLSAQVRLGLFRVCQRSPKSEEVARIVDLIGALSREHLVSEERARAAAFTVLLNLSEFLFVN